MSFLYLTLNWGFGILFLLIGLFSMVSFSLGTICLIVMAALLLPPIRNFVYSKTNKALSVKVRAILISSLFIASGVFISQSEERKFQELAVKQAQEQAEKSKKLKLRQEKIDYFNINRSEIISTLKGQFSEKDYKGVLSQSRKYLVSKDKELIQINYKAEEELKSIMKAEKDAREKAEREDKTIKILAKLKIIKDSEYKKNMESYKQLSLLHPNNEKYKEKLDFYKKKHEEKEIKEKKEKENKRLTKLGLKWDYQESEEKMGRGTIKYAFVDSLNKLNFDFPYKGSQRVTLQLRKHPKHGKDVILTIEKGQFTCSYRDCKVAVRFDKGKPINYNATKPSDHSTTTLFINNYKSFVARAKKSEKISIEVEFYREGFNIIEFNSEGLEF